MKKHLLLFAVLFPLFVLNAQQTDSSAAYTIENELGEKLDFRIVSCVGSINSQTVNIVFTLLQDSTNQYIHLCENVILDSDGNNFEYKRPEDYRCSYDGFYVPTKQLRKSKTIITGVLPKVKTIAYLEYKVRFKNDREYSKIIIRNLPIEWR